MTVTVYTSQGAVDKTFTDVTMCVLNDDGLCQLMRTDDGVSHLDTFKAEHNVTIQRVTT